MSCKSSYVIIWAMIGLLTHAMEYRPGFICYPYGKPHSEIAFIGNDKLIMTG